jgi:hypothetical protein
MSTTESTGGPQGGNPWGLEAEDPGYGRVPAFGPSLWRRMVQEFSGDPLPGNQHFAPPAAAQLLTIPDFAISATVSITGDTCRVSFDTPATAANGFVAPVGTLFDITGRGSLKAASFFPNSAATVVDVVYWS